MILGDGDGDGDGGDGDGLSRSNCSIMWKKPMMHFITSQMHPIAEYIISNEVRGNDWKFTGNSSSELRSSRE